jgi:hypothetical protein
MNDSKNAGLALLIGSFLLTVTMVLHPAGGSFEHLLKATKIIVISHAIAIVAMPVCYIGFKGLLQKLGKENLLSQLAMAFSIFGLIAGMLAGAVNGLALPIFINRFADADGATIEILKPILKYGMSINHALDYILIGMLCLSVLMWSIEIVKKKRLFVWLGCFGILITLTAVIMLVSGFVFVNLHGFRVFVFGLVAWIVWAGIALLKTKTEETK